MKLRTTIKLAIACLSFSALMRLTSELWLYRFMHLEVFSTSHTPLTILAAVEVLTYHVPLIIFFGVLYRMQNTGKLK